ncbi:hydantoinase/oxoprolinase family protein [Candidatus Formimonas warabiya]|uniref:5-oxoprolinase n=1 Tax=Formimonas warabiya TaxID=1761012 RepID=A0A3G1KRA0_FORW1|nr:hydantoinase/oxoprolinase family protein [Candidatus Formimonas warabiya]ATW24967.1 5-oxoprolinase [Candidatus Formimonas warabiya]
MGFRLGVDTGGTFTDIGLIHEETGAVAVTKVPSTPDNPARAVVNGVIDILGKEGIAPRDIDFFIHGTTVATNALLELKGARTALITTEGFQDVLHIGRQTRPSLYNFYAHRPKPIIPRHLRYEVPERILHTGKVWRELDQDRVREIARDMKRKDVHAVAVCLLHAYANPRHEQRIKEILIEELPGLFITVSSEILPEFREYERTSTVCINAYVMPKVNKYVADLAEQLHKLEVKSGLYIMQSNGGVITAETARESSARTVLSGPAGGALAGTFVCAQTGRDNLITVDMGGTSLDICLIADQQPKYTTESHIGGYPIKLPMIDIHTIGAGGGSIAWIDSGGALRVGPESAGAVPGPVCYCKGGQEPTVTDANVVLGRLNPRYLLDGDFQLDVEKAYQAIEKKIAQPLGLTVIEAAAGIIKVVNANMVRGIRVVSVEKGYDPREFSLVAFGGAGPVHGVEMAEELGMPEVIVPKNPGINSALGMLVADVRHDYVRTHVKSMAEITGAELTDLFGEMEKQGSEQLAQEGFSPSDMVFLRSADVRYRGQAYEISIPVWGGTLTLDEIQRSKEHFHLEHEKAYGYRREKETVEMVNLRLVALGKLPRMELVKEQESNQAIPEPVACREVYFSHGFLPTAVYNRKKFRYGVMLRGPAIVEQLDSTTVIFPDQDATVDAFGNMIIKLKGGKKNA